MRMQNKECLNNNENYIVLMSMELMLLDLLSHVFVNVPRMS